MEETRPTVGEDLTARLWAAAAEVRELGDVRGRWTVMERLDRVDGRLACK